MVMGCFEPVMLKICLKENLSNITEQLTVFKYWSWQPLTTGSEQLSIFSPLENNQSVLAVDTFLVFQLSRWYGKKSHTCHIWDWLSSIYHLFCCNAKLNLFLWLCILGQTQTNIHEMVSEMHTNQTNLEKRVNKIEDKLATLQVQSAAGEAKIFPILFFLLMVSTVWDI